MSEFKFVRFVFGVNIELNKAFVVAPADAQYLAISRIASMRVISILAWITQRKLQVGVDQQIFARLHELFWPPCAVTKDCHLLGNKPGCQKCVLLDTPIALVCPVDEDGSEYMIDPESFHVIVSMATPQHEALVPKPQAKKAKRKTATKQDE